jgi:hypothetical protein
MVVKPLRIFALILLLSIAGIAMASVIKSRLSYESKINQEKFISAYLDISIARGKFSNEEDSLKTSIENIYRKHEVDSAWMAAYAKKLPDDLLKSEQIWDIIVGKLDSMRQVVHQIKPDSSLSQPRPKTPLRDGKSRELSPRAK